MRCRGRDAGGGRLEEHRSRKTVTGARESQQAAALDDDVGDDEAGSQRDGDDDHGERGVDGGDGVALEEGLERAEAERTGHQEDDAGEFWDR